VEITRRNALIGAAAGVGLVGLAGLGLQERRALVGRLRTVATPALPAGAPGALPEADLALLLATADALLGGPRDLAPYRRMFEARSRSLPGYRELYRRLGRALERRAARERATSFVTLPVQRRQEILSDLCPPGRLARLRTGLTDPDRTRFRLYVVREVLDLYAATGAWRTLEFGPPPGLPRGLDAYTRPPAGRGSGGSSPLTTP